MSDMKDGIFKFFRSNKNVCEMINWNVSVDFCSSLTIYILQQYAVKYC